MIAVGADDTRGTDDPKDDVIPSWQTRGNAVRHPDVVAPGKSIVSLRDPGSFVDEANPGARVGYGRFFRGSGSSQAAAIVSGAVATLLSQRPQLSPDEIKALLMRSAVRLPNADPVAQGAGLINLHRAREMKTETFAGSVQTWERSTGLGSLQLARGTVTAEDEGVVLQGEQTIFGDPWDPTHLGRRELGRHVLVERHVARSYLVGELLVWGELGGSHLVRADVERQLVVRADMERTHVVGSDVERGRLVIRWMDRSGRTLQPRRGSMGQHVLGPLT